jgi:polysaccharide export outer membrane protein
VLTAGSAVAQYQLCPQDVLEVSVWQHEDLNRTLTVASEGTITYPLAGTVQAKGLSVDELTAELVKRVSKYVPNPQITVSVREYTGLSVSVLGQVNKSGHYTIAGSKTMIDLIADAGGFTQDADLKHVRLIREGKTQEVNLQRALDGKQTLVPVIEPKDTIYVPERWWSWMDFRNLQTTLTLCVLGLQIYILSK